MSQSKLVGVVETAVHGCRGFHVRLDPDAEMPKVGTPLYTAPQPTKREPLTWVALSDDEVRSLWLQSGGGYRGVDGVVRPLAGPWDRRNSFARAIESALLAKNGVKA